MSGDGRAFAPGSVDYDGDMGRHFDRGRALSPETIETWREIVVGQLASRKVRRLLDLGSGSGRFSWLLASWLRCDVLAVEPSHTMRRQAARHATPRVHNVGGSAEAIPVADGSVDVAWLSHVFHHVRDKGTAAAELHRVLAGSGRVLLRSTFGDRLEGVTLFHFFPEARGVAERFPRLDDIQRIFAAAGFECASVERVRQQTCADLKTGAALTRHRVDTTLRMISDQAFEEGQARIEAAAEVEAGPVWDEMDLVVFVKA